MPAPCAGISLASLTRLLPHPTGSRLSNFAGAMEDSCKWSSPAGAVDRTLESDIVLFTSPNAISEAGQFYDIALGELTCHCAGTSVSRRSVTGLGDVATALFITPGPNARDISDSADPFPGITLIVRSRNAGIVLNYNITAGSSQPVSADAAQLTGIIAMARGVLAALARPAAVPPGSLAPVSAEPHYAGSRDPCRLIAPATLARYAPGATVSMGSTPEPTQIPSGGQVSSCDWGSDANLSVWLNLTVFRDAVRAREGFTTDAQALSRSSSAIEVTGSRLLTDLGEEAAVIYQTRAAAHGVEVFVWSGNLELDYFFTPPASLDRTALLTAGVAMARDGLAALASRSASSYPQEPVYASPDDACHLIKASTLATYAPGASIDALPNPPAGPLQITTCIWQASDGDLILNVTIYSGPDDALGGYQSDLHSARQNQNGDTFKQARPVKGLGEQATAIFGISLGEPEVNLYVLSGNAEIEVSFSDLPFSPALSQAGKLTADIAMARDVLAGLRH